METNEELWQEGKRTLQSATPINNTQYPAQKMKSRRSSFFLIFLENENPPGGPTGAPYVKSNTSFGLPLRREIGYSDTM